MKNNEDFGIEVLNEYRAIAGSVFDASVFQSMIDDSRGQIKRAPANSRLLREDSEINRICVQAHFYRRENSRIIINQSNLINEAVRLTEFLRKEYHLQ